MKRYLYKHYFNEMRLAGQDPSRSEISICGKRFCGSLKKNICKSLEKNMAA